MGKRPLNEVRVRFCRVIDLGVLKRRRGDARALVENAVFKRAFDDLGDGGLERLACEKFFESGGKR
jgi:hypothetical protein